MAVLHAGGPTWLGMISTSAHSGEKSPGSVSRATAGGDRAEPHAPLAKTTRGYMQILSLSSVGLEMAIAVVLGLLGGQWLDGRYGTAPLFLVIGVLAGCGAAAKAVWVAVVKADRMIERDAAPPDGDR